MWLELCTLSRDVKKRPIVARRVADYLTDPELKIETIVELLELPENHYFKMCMNKKFIKQFPINYTMSKSIAAPL